MTDAMTLDHTDAEVLAAFVDGQLSGEELEAVQAHLAECELCRMTIGEAVAFDEEEQPQRAPRRAWAWGGWGAVAAGVVGVALLAPSYERYEANKSLQPLWGAEAQSERFIAGRLSRQMPYAKLHPITRDAAPLQLNPRLQIAANDIRQKYENKTSPSALRVKAAVLAATQRNPAKALATLRQVPENKRDAAIWNDLAALSLAQAKWVRNAAGEGAKAAGAPSSELLREALAAADHALQDNPKMREALFNRALILKEMNDPRRLQALKDYLAVDSSSEWAAELTTNDLSKALPPLVPRQ